MMKSSVIFSVHTIHIFLRNTLIFFTVLFISLFIWLKFGIKVDNFIVYKYQVSGLYIKLDKKLTLKAKTVTIPKSKENPSFDRIDETFERVNYLLTFFDYIEIKKIHF